MSFASLVKEELSLKSVEYEKDELSALFKTSGNISISNGKIAISFKTENAKIAQKPGCKSIIRRISRKTKQPQSTSFITYTLF